MKINVGIIGLGEVAQLVHLPILSDLNDKYRIKVCLLYTSHAAHERLRVELGRRRIIKK